METPRQDAGASATAKDRARPPPLPRWVLPAESPLAVEVAAAAERILSEISAAPDAEKLAFLCDTRAAHRVIFTIVAPADLPEAAGSYRGTPGSALEGARRAVFSARRVPGLKLRDMCTPPDEVLPEMTALAARIAQIWSDPPAGEARFDALAEIVARFLRCHPYLDGNGHICRMMADVLARRLGLSVATDWRPAPRPYDHHMSLCLQWYPHHPLLLACYLRKWFA